MNTGDAGWMAKIRSSIAARLILSTAGVAIALFALAIAGAYQRSSAEAQRSIHSDLRNGAIGLSKSIDTWFEGRRLLVEMVGQSIAVRPPGIPIRSLLQRPALNDNSLISYYGDAQREFFNYPDRFPLPRGYDPRLRPWYSSAAEHRGTILTVPYRDATYDSLLVTLATPVFRRGRLIGVAAADFEIRALADMLDRFNVDGSRSAFLVDRRGTILVDRDPALVGKSLKSVFDNRPPTVSQGLSSVTRHGVRQFVTFNHIANLPNADWYVAVSVNEATIYAKFKAEYRNAAISIALITILALFVIWALLAKLVLVPLRRMTAAMQGVADGRLDTTISDSDRGDEIGAMARAVEVFRDNGILILQLTKSEAEHLAQQALERSWMLNELHRAFGTVVDAAVAGDFSKRVPDRFSDVELNALARSVNKLVETTHRGLAETGKVLSALARTDLTLRIDGHYQGAFAKLKADTNAVADRFHSVVSQLHCTSHQLKVATTYLVEGAADLSNRTRDQAIAVQTTSLAIRQLSQTVADNAGSAEAASRRTQEVGHSAQAGGEIVVQAADAMSQMTHSAATISRIITLIDDIAERTALIAVNASIEAARAGRAGLGFAVVAVEVRTLAQHASKASGDVKALIEETTNAIESGSTLVADVADKLSNILVAVSDNSVLLEAIVAVGRAQVCSITSINVAAEQIDAITSDNNVLVGDLNGAIILTQSRASELDSIVDQFTLVRNDHSIRT
ncbi:MAG: methyl-accepting chemotaxis protein [Pseudomonadota bacterium]|nr:methyl-accepting chemotaxis protein [Pseudomonadota bacterium]